MLFLRVWSLVPRNSTWWRSVGCRGRREAGKFHFANGKLSLDSTLTEKFSFQLQQIILEIIEQFHEYLPQLGTNSWWDLCDPVSNKQPPAQGLNLAPRGYSIAPRLDKRQEDDRENIGIQQIASDTLWILSWNQINHNNRRLNDWYGSNLYATHPQLTQCYCQWAGTCKMSENSMAYMGKGVMWKTPHYFLFLQPLSCICKSSKPAFARSAFVEK